MVFSYYTKVDLVMHSFVWGDKLMQLHTWFLCHMEQKDFVLGSE